MFLSKKYYIHEKGHSFVYKMCKVFINKFGEETA